MAMTEEQREQFVAQQFEKARRGVLAQIKEKGGSASLGDLHEFSLKKYFIQHQRFSQLMETLVDNDLATFDDTAYVVTITAKGEEFLTSEA